MFFFGSFFCYITKNEHFCYILKKLNMITTTTHIYIQLTNTNNKYGR